jgi:hypothetical protein
MFQRQNKIFLSKEKYKATKKFQEMQGAHVVQVKNINIAVGNLTKI